jgi:lipoprotein-anchoring transpeptidase ErfK/SrfK
MPSLIGYATAVCNERKATSLKNSRLKFVYCPVVLKIVFFVGATLAIGVLVYSHHNWNPLPAAIIIDRIAVEKSARKLSIFSEGKSLKSYRVALGRNPLGPKQQEGDMKTPEGIYQVDYRNPLSDYHLALHISYPSADDVARAAERGVPAGFDIMIHGLPNGHGWIGAFHRWKDWTAGCIALTDEEIEELWRVTPDGTPVEIRP